MGHPKSMMGSDIHPHLASRFHIMSKVLTYNMDHQIQFLKYYTQFLRNYHSYRISNEPKYVVRMTKALDKLNKAFQRIDFDDSIWSCQFYMEDLLQCQAIHATLTGFKYFFM